VLTHPFNWKRLSISAALCYWPDRSRAQVVFDTQPGSYNTETLIAFLGRLHDHLGHDQKVTLLWDGLSSHRSKDMTAYLHTQRSWLRVERLPAYAPDLNPVEGLWGNVKGQELANLCVEQLRDVADAAIRGLRRAGTDAPLCLALLRHAGLSL
jgi:transposase